MDSITRRHRLSVIAIREELDWYLTVETWATLATPLDDGLNELMEQRLHCGPSYVAIYLFQKQNNLLSAARTCVVFPFSHFFSFCWEMDITSSHVWSCYVYLIMVWCDTAEIEYPHIQNIILFMAAFSLALQIDLTSVEGNGAHHSEGEEINGDVSANVWQQEEYMASGIWRRNQMIDP